MADQVAEIRYHLYLRSDCSLCEAMLYELGTFSEALLQQTELRDVDADPRWQSLYGPLVPLLATADGEEICHYYLDLDRLQD